MIPLTAAEKEFTNIYFYPIYSPSAFTVDLEVYDASGALLGRVDHIVKVVSPKDELIPIRLKEVCQQLGIPLQPHLAVRVIAHPCEGSRLPARVKLGLDVGASPAAMPCNICTNLQPFNPALEAKAKSFKWAPLLTDHPHASAWIMNSTPHVNYTNKAIVEVTFFRESDDKTLIRKLEIPPHGFVVIDPDEDQELHHFLQGSIGWFTATSSNPYTTTYYFSTAPHGIVGGDHGF
jgi:hypothetical protein